MAKYSREQRDRAVDLYIKYERCAADVIRELGYPSRGMLPVWYRERLEEERTGVPSRRGERYRRYTDEQKRAAVDHYLEYGRRLSRTMRALGYPKSHELLTAWIDELAPGRRKAEGTARFPRNESGRRWSRSRPEGRNHAMPPPDWAWRRPSSGNWKRQMLAGSKETHVTKTPGEKPPTAGEGKTSVEPSTPEAMPPTAGPRDAAGLADAVAALEKRLAETRTRLERVGRRCRTATTGEEGTRHRDRDPEGRVGAVGKRAGRVPEKPGQPREGRPRQTDQ